MAGTESEVFTGFDELDALDDDSTDVVQVEQFVENYESEIEAEAKAIEEVDKRLEKAIYYREILKTPLFEDASQIAQDVNDEIREFVHTRLQNLMGMKTKEEVAQVVNQFDEDEANQIRALLSRFDDKELIVLKALAVKFKGKASLIESTPSKPSSPIVQKPSRPVPVEKRPDKPVPAPRKAQMRRVQQPAAATPAPAVARPQGKAATKPGQGKPAGQVINTPDGQKAVKVGRKIYKRELNDAGQFFAKDVTPVPRDPSALPFPSSPDAMTAISMDHAQRSAAANPALTGSGTTSLAVARALSNKGEE